MQRKYEAYTRGRVAESEEGHWVVRIVEAQALPSEVVWNWTGIGVYPIRCTELATFAWKGISLGLAHMTLVDDGGGELSVGLGPPEGVKEV